MSPHTSILGRRQALGVLLALALLLSGREVRRRLLVGPDGNWRHDLWLDALVEAPAQGDPGDAPSGAAVPTGGPAASPEALAAAPTGAPGPNPAPGPARAAEVRPRSRGGSKPAKLTSPLRINACSADSLQLLPGVGPVLATRIEEARRAGTVFRGPGDLLAIRGIGPAAMARLAPLVLFAAPAPPPRGRDNPH